MTNLAKIKRLYLWKQAFAKLFEQPLYVIFKYCH